MKRLIEWLLLHFVWCALSYNPSAADISRRAISPGTWHSNTLKYKCRLLQIIAHDIERASRDLPRVSATFIMDGTTLRVNQQTSSMLDCSPHSFKADVVVYQEGRAYAGLYHYRFFDLGTRADFECADAFLATQLRDIENGLVVGLDTEQDLIQLAFPSSNVTASAPASESAPFEELNLPLSPDSICGTVVVLNAVKLGRLSTRRILPNLQRILKDSRVRFVTADGTCEMRNLEKIGLSFPKEQNLELYNISGVAPGFPVGLKSMFSCFYPRIAYPRSKFIPASYCGAAKGNMTHSGQDRLLYASFDAFATLAVYANLVDVGARSWWQNEQFEAERLAEEMEQIEQREFEQWLAGRAGEHRELEQLEAEWLAGETKPKAICSNLLDRYVRLCAPLVLKSISEQWWNSCHPELDPKQYLPGKMQMSKTDRLLVSANFKKQMELVRTVDVEQMLKSLTSLPPDAISHVTRDLRNYLLSLKSPYRMAMRDAHMRLFTDLFKKNKRGKK